MTEHQMETPALKPAEHGPNFKAYIKVFVALSILTGVSFLANLILAQHFGLVAASMWVILAVSVAKATLVAVIFMHLIVDWSRVYCIIIPVCIMGVMMMIVLLPDIVVSWHHYMYRP